MGQFDENHIVAMQAFWMWQKQQDPANGHDLSQNFYSKP